MGSRAGPGPVRSACPTSGSRRRRRASIPTGGRCRCTTRRRRGRAGPSPEGRNRPGRSPGFAIGDRHGHAADQIVHDVSARRRAPRAGRPVSAADLDADHLLFILIPDSWTAEVGGRISPGASPRRKEAGSLLDRASIPPQAQPESLEPVNRGIRTSQETSGTTTILGLNRRLDRRISVTRPSPSLPGGRRSHPTLTGQDIPRSFYKPVRGDARRVRPVFALEGYRALSPISAGSAAAPPRPRAGACVARRDRRPIVEPVGAEAHGDAYNVAVGSASHAPEPPHEPHRQWTSNSRCAGSDGRSDWYKSRPPPRYPAGRPTPGSTRMPRSGRVPSTAPAVPVGVLAARAWPWWWRACRRLGVLILFFSDHRRALGRSWASPTGN